MEPLMRLVVPEMDGGLLRPLFDTVSDNMGNFTAKTDFEFRLDSPEDLLNQTDPSEEVALNSTHELIVTFVDVGQPILRWYLGRLRSQTPLFLIAALLWLMLLGCLIGAFLLMRRLKARHTRRIGFASSSQRQLKPLIGLLTAIFLLTVAGCVLAILHWSGRAQFSGMSEQQGGNDTSQGSNESVAAGRSHLTATFRRTIDEFDQFVERSIIDTNVTVLSVCKEELPNVLRVLETIATYLLDKLAQDFKLSPLLSSFDEFIDLIKLLVDSMRAIKESRSDVVSPLAEFATLIESVRRDIEKQASSACRDAGRTSAAPPVSLCDRVSSNLARLAVGIDHRQLDSDSSVTIVTLLEKMLKLNFSQVEGQVSSAKGQLYGSLDLVKAEVRKQFNQLVVAVSAQFENALVDAEFFRSNLRGAKRDPGFLVAMEAIDMVVLGLGVSLAIGSVAFLAILFLVLFVSIRYLLSLRGVQQPAREEANGNDEVDLVFIRQSAASPSKSTAKKPAANGNGSSLLRNGDNLILPRSRQSSVEPRDWHSSCLLVSCLLVLAAFVYAAAVFYAGAEAQMDACRYLTTETGVAKLDEFVDRLVEDKLWPQIQTLLDREVKIPLGINRQQIPRQILGSLLARCQNASTTIFQALELGNLVNVSRVLQLPEVMRELNKGSDMIQGLVRDLNTSNLIPSEVDDLLQKTLPSFAAVIDAENFSPSIRELGHPLLLIGPQLPQLRADLGELEARLLRANSSDSRAVLIRHFAERADSLIAERSATLSARLDRLLRHYTVLQTHRRLTNLTLVLTANAVALKGALSDKPLLLSAIRVRYGETLEGHMPDIVALLTGVLSRLQARVGRCGPLRDVLQIPVGWCRSQMQPVPFTAFCMMASCLAFYILVLLLLALMHLMKHQTVAGPRVRR